LGELTSEKKNTTPVEKPGDEIERLFQAYKSAHGLPRKKYFEKIWNSIELKAPVGEKYYLRWFFALFFVLALVIIFGLFYSDFLTSIVTLKEIRKTAINQPLVLDESSKPFNITPGVVFIPKENTVYHLDSDDPRSTVISIYSGHAVVEKKTGSKIVTIILPDMKLYLEPKESQCNIFCYDGIIRIIPLNTALEIEWETRRIKVFPGSIWFLLHGKEFLLSNGS